MPWCLRRLAMIWRSKRMAGLRLEKKPLPRDSTSLTAITAATGTFSSSAAHSRSRWPSRRSSAGRGFGRSVLVAVLLTGLVQHCLCLGARQAVHHQPAALLEGAHRLLGQGAELTIHRQ